MQDIFIKSSKKKERERREKLLQELRRLVGVRPPSPAMSTLCDNPCLLCRFFGAAGAGGGGGAAIKRGLPEGFGAVFLWATRGRSRERESGPGRPGAARLSGGSSL